MIFLRKLNERIEAMEKRIKALEDRKPEPKDDDSVVLMTQERDDGIFAHQKRGQHLGEDEPDFQD